MTSFSFKEGQVSHVVCRLPGAASERATCPQGVLSTQHGLDVAMWDSLGLVIKCWEIELRTLPKIYLLDHMFSDHPQALKYISMTHPRFISQHLVWFNSCGFPCVHGFRPSCHCGRPLCCAYFFFFGHIRPPRPWRGWANVSWDGENKLHTNTIVKPLNQPGSPMGRILCGAWQSDGDDASMRLHWFETGP